MSARSVVSRIEGVTVFSRGAMITRVAELDGVDAAGQVRIAGLPLAADDASVRARVEPAGNGSALAVTDVRVALEAADARLSPPPDQRELDEARQAERVARSEVARAERELARLRSVTVPARPRLRDGRTSPGPVAARLALLDRLRVRGERVAAELATLRMELGRSEARRAELDDRLRRGSTDRSLDAHTLRKTAVVTLAAAEATLPAGSRLHLEYFVPGARWAPAYVVRVAADGTSATVEARAVAAQRTGEDWTAARLTLSTAAPQQWVELPELPSLRIGRRQRPPARTGWRPLPPGIDELYADWDRAFGKAPPATELPRASAPPPLLLEMQELGEESALEAEPVYPLIAPGTSPPPDWGSVPVTSAMPGRGRGLGLFSGASKSVAAPPRPSAPPRAAASPRASAPAAAMKVSLARPEPDAPAELRAPRDLLDYGRLRMPPPGSGHRGRLMEAQAAELYFELLVDVRVETRVAVQLVGQAVDSALDEAGRAGRSLPPQYRLAATSEGFDYAWTADAAVDIPSDGDYHSVPLTAKAAATRMRLVTVPRETLDVFRSLEFENPFPSALLAGPVDVYLGGEFLLTTDLRTTAPGGRARLGLGVEPSVKVARNARFREETAGLTSSTLVLEHRIEVDLASLLPHAVEVEVRERVPVAPADQNDVKVEMGDARPAWESYDPPPVQGELLRGGRRWTVSLAPGEKKRLEASYRVRIPAKDELVGGNRREP